MDNNTKPLKLDKTNWDATIKEGYTLVDFWAEWCYPCKMIAPIIEELAKEWDGKIKVAKLDTDADPEIGSLYGITGIPTLILFKDGKVHARMTGAASKPVYIDFLTKNYN